MDSGVGPAVVDVTVNVSPGLLMAVAPSPKVVMSKGSIADPERVRVSASAKDPAAYHPKSSSYPTARSESKYKPSIA